MNAPHDPRGPDPTGNEGGLRMDRPTLHSPRYELVDLGIFMVLYGLIGYVWTVPPMVVREGLAQPFAVFDQQVWGYTMSAVGLILLLAAFTLRHRTIDAVFRIAFVYNLFWATQPLIGVIFYEAPLRNLLSVLVFAMTASHIMRARVRFGRDGWK